jgi:hypothetical protein
MCCLLCMNVLYSRHVCLPHWLLLIFYQCLHVPAGLAFKPLRCLALSLTASVNTVWRRAGCCVVTPRSLGHCLAVLHHDGCHAAALEARVVVSVRVSGYLVLLAIRYGWHNCALQGTGCNAQHPTQFVIAVILDYTSAQLVKPFPQF